MLEELKPVRRWTARRKMAVLWAIERGLCTEDQVKDAHCLSEEELNEWRRRYKPELLNDYR